ncbi:winged helix DNA-binding protein [Panacagrimonas perspica]|uniref:Winged helix DNA-binding protein n=1 Tax=Panacagrimonas perspica TaxID=381431 RepID=A0A4R7NZU7_9GAMM|nr:MarR family winged helix-turn-helix transcriptional regulator [Panacagrimonas perspica]TDU26893.1 winged helix DNA-binding protein [Panacagrimonas perspica]
MSPGHDKPAKRARSTVAPTGGALPAPISEAAKEFLDLFYPVHYKIGIGIEDALRGGRLSRHQVAILWLIRSAGEGGRTIPRKEIERSITRWFELRNSAISKTLRGMAREPLSLLEIREHPLSGREREVILTAKGAREIERMVDEGRRFIQTMVNHLSGTEATDGVHFLTRVSSVIDVVQPATKVSAGPPRRKAAKPR